VIGSRAAANSSRLIGDSTCRRMKKRPVSALENCWLSVMLPRAWTTAPDTACTMPGWSGQAKVRVQWLPAGRAPDHAASLPVGRVLAEAGRGVADAAGSGCIRPG
jgi:hypothetical protein